MNAVPRQYVVVYCRGDRVLARWLGNGWCLCPCGERISCVPPDDEVAA